MLIYFQAWNIAELYNIIWIYVFTYLGIHSSTDGENVVLRDATNKGGLLVIGNAVCFFTIMGSAVTRGDCWTGVAIKRSYHHLLLYFLDFILWF